ncbi:hypothetical protein BDV96DRAFT_568177 [Lophiotrema nucula]|uniref:Ubiquitin-like domain-containing protein n=1 Tax=Lophiotrema nucula TaxID=690887 RepID=A0A6A5ZMT0_9PLEO|nr:hypothetical protein BDV96DRAFT_568177 [Lophiotrema nucula]
MNEKSALEAQESFDFLYVEEATAEGGESRRINFRTSQTVEALKRVIAAELRVQHDWSKLDLVSAGRELTELGKTLESYGIFDGDTVFYARDTTTTARPPAYSPPTTTGVRTLDNVMFKDLHGKTLTLHGIPVTWTVKQMRYKLGIEKHLSDQVEDYRFIYNGKQLVDENNLELYQLTEGCTIQIVLRLPGGIVR